MKKVLTLSLVLFASATVASHAGVRLSINLGGNYCPPPVYYAPQPTAVYYVPPQPVYYPNPIPVLVPPQPTVVYYNNAPGYYYGPQYNQQVGVTYYTQPSRRVYYRHDYCR